MNIIFVVKRWRIEGDNLIKQESLSLVEPGAVQFLLDTDHSLAISANYVRYINEVRYP